ncbi:hypothetical protein LSH36_399g03005 [Paralvinella palmiformis]|uniref:Uncharacterized protein n=1 Tax=Paralvinella palmiformis TaxID=53620 RepID=A0AAD9JCU2_9ANNE|nr:hypothetical protein LSH36_399g03005 [Paralvinella palmiformis]
MFDNKVKLEGSVIRSNFRQEVYKNTTLFDWRHFVDVDIRRQFSKVADIGNSVLEDLTYIMANSRDWDELLWAWRGWRQSTGTKMKEKYADFVDLLNKAAIMNNFSDAGDYWRSWYEDPDFEAECLRLWTELKPIYQQLHALHQTQITEDA